MRISDWSSDVCSSDLQFDIAEHRGAVRHRHTPRHTPGALRYSVRFLAQPVPEVRGFPLKRRDSVEPLTDQRLGHAACEGKAHAVEHHFLAITVVQRRDRRRSHGLGRSEEHTSELQSLMRISYAVFCLKKKQHYTCAPTNAPPSTTYSP